ncbi:MAG TPA: Flp pilus assembly protein CpaB [Hyphomicrobiales bacterium]|nr:Flp pilus assembly protein CpaB [Hyphomicrobiales bacterium]
MKSARVIVFAIALIAGGLAAALVIGGFRQPAPPRPQAAAPTFATADVLVAATDIPVGGTVTPKSVKWAAWPKASAGEFITRQADPKADQKYVGALARLPVVAGEPIRPEKLVHSDGSGYMSAILPAGKRAVAIEISAVNDAGGFILPNDRVDVLLTHRQQVNGKDQFSSETILHNIRVLAIDQTLSDKGKDGKKSVIGRTATLAVDPGQAELLTRSRQQGSLSLALRSLADANAPAADDNIGGSMTVVRYGVASQAAVR